MLQELYSRKGLLFLFLAPTAYLLVVWMWGHPLVLSTRWVPRLKRLSELMVNLVTTPPQFSWHGHCIPQTSCLLDGEPPVNIPTLHSCLLTKSKPELWGRVLFQVCFFIGYSHSALGYSLEFFLHVYICYSPVVINCLCDTFLVQITVYCHFLVGPCLMSWVKMR